MFVQVWRFQGILSVFFPENKMQEIQAGLGYQI